MPTFASREAMRSSKVEAVESTGAADEGTWVKSA